jgi:hypothetical protein
LVHVVGRIDGGKPADQNNRHREKAPAQVAGDPEPHAEADASAESDAGMQRNPFGIQEEPVFVETYFGQRRGDAGDESGDSADGRHDDDGADTGWQPRRGIGLQEIPLHCR